MNTRQKQIKAAHAETFKWIFDETGEHVYWISGKAGLGKSTLMQYICEEVQTEHYLTQWSGASHQLIVAKFFFWSAGSETQRTSLGFFQSMIFQILDNCLAVIDRISQHSDISGLRNMARDQPGPLPLWTESRLEKLFRCIIND